jgi:hypothetical protein
MILTLSLHDSLVILVPTQANPAYKRRFLVSSHEEAAHLSDPIYKVATRAFVFFALPPAGIGKSGCLVAHPTDGIAKAVVADSCTGVEKAILFQQ